MNQARHRSRVINDSEGSPGKENTAPAQNYDNHDKVTRHSSGAGLVTRSSFPSYLKVTQQSTCSNNPFEVSEKVKACGENSLADDHINGPCSDSLLNAERPSVLSSFRSSDPVSEGTIADRVKRNRRGRNKRAVEKQAIASVEEHVGASQEQNPL